MTQTYKEYLDGPVWKQRRLDKFNYSGRKCEACGSKKRLQVHHLTYERIFQEDMEDLMVLCKTHHKAVEEMYKSRRLSKTGDPFHLRTETLKSLSEPTVPSKEDSFWGITCTTPRPEMVSILLQQEEFYAVLLMKRGPAKTQIKKLARKAGPLANKMYINLQMTYDAFHGVGHYSKFKREVHGIAEKIGFSLIPETHSEVPMLESEIKVKRPSEWTKTRSRRTSIPIGKVKGLVNTFSDYLIHMGLQVDTDDKWRLVATISSWAGSVGVDVTTFAEGTPLVVYPSNSKS